ncbi:MAG TPA: hypothetical protein VGJ97_12690 [Anaerolineaceae bacterium]|jgi:hypothetical protein
MQPHREPGESKLLRGQSRMPAHSLFYERIVPLLLVVLGVIAAGLVLFAAGVLLGIVKF